MIKKLSIIIASIIALPFIIALFIKSEYAVERQVTINQPYEEVFNYLKQLKNQDNFSKWAAMDPNMKKSYRGIDGTVGFVSAWDSDNEEVGKGEQEIISIFPNKRIDFELRFLSPFESTSPAYMTTSALNTDKTTVSWGFSGNMDYPMNLMFLFMDFEQIIGDDLQTGLNNLKVILEKEQ
jgi:uncharacterized protein YndB with AHSA1/START domain